MGLFKKKTKDQNHVKTAEQLIMEQVVTTDDSHITALAKKMIDGAPLILNFDRLNIDDANKIIAFLSGVVYAIDGHIVEIAETTILFANNMAYNDGSLDQFLLTL